MKATTVLVIILSASVCVSGCFAKEPDLERNLNTSARMLLRNVVGLRQDGEDVARCWLTGRTSNHVRRDEVLRRRGAAGSTAVLPLLQRLHRLPPRLVGVFQLHILLPDEVEQLNLGWARGASEGAAPREHATMPPSCICACRPPRSNHRPAPPRSNHRQPTLPCNSIVPSATQRHKRHSDHQPCAKTFMCLPPASEQPSARPTSEQPSATQRAISTTSPSPHAVKRPPPLCKDPHTYDCPRRPTVGY